MVLVIESSLFIETYNMMTSRLSSSTHEFVLVGENF